MTQIFPALQCGSAHPHHERGRDWFEAEGTLSWHVGHAGHAGHAGHVGHAGLCQALSWHAGQVFGLWQAFDHSGFEFCFPRFFWFAQILFAICNKYFSVLSVFTVLVKHISTRLIYNSPAGPNFSQRFL